jgi:cytochrome b561
MSGYFLSNSAGHDVIVLGTNIALPRLVGKNKQLSELSGSAHFWLAYTFLAFVVLHSVDQRKYLRATLRRFYKAAIRAR